MVRIANIPASHGTQMPLFTTPSKWKVPRIGDLATWDGAKRIALDVETCDPLLREMGIGVRRGGYVVGVSYAIEGGPKHYLPMKHQMGGNVESVDQAWAFLRAQIKGFTGTVVGAHLSYDLDYLMEEGCDFSNVSWFRDIQVAEPLIDELQNRFSLEALSQKYLGIGKQEDELTNAAADWGFHHKKELWRLPGTDVGSYAEGDVTQPLEILAFQEKVIVAEGLQPIFDLESRLLPVLVKMRRRGVRIDMDQLDRVEKWASREELKNLAIIKHITGAEPGYGNCWKAAALVRPLEAAGHKVPMSGAKPKPSVTKEWLDEKKRAGCKVSGAILRMRQVNKLRTTFAASVRRYGISHGFDNFRVHCTLNQTIKDKESNSSGSGGDEDTEGAAYGRLSCVHPNLQQQPGRDPEFAPMWRAVYVPDHGKIWAANDYSQQEPRWTVAFAELARPYKGAPPGLKGSHEAGDAYRNDPTTDNHEMMAKMAGIKRKEAKEIFLGLCYGMGGAKLARKLSLPTKWIETKKRGNVEVAGDEAKLILDKFDEKVPFVKLLAKQLQELAEKRGWIKTAGGRKCHFPKNDDGGYDWCHKALNRLIQGSAGDQTKQALVDLDDAGHYIQLQIHDEIDGSVADAAEAEAQAEIMRRALPSSVPSKVDTELGSSWGGSMGWAGWPE